MQSFERIMPAYIRGGKMNRHSALHIIPLVLLICFFCLLYLLHKEHRPQSADSQGKLQNSYMINKKIQSFNKSILDHLCYYIQAAHYSSFSEHFDSASPILRFSRSREWCHANGACGWARAESLLHDQSFGRVQRSGEGCAGYLG